MANQGMSSEVMTPLGEMAVGIITVQYFHHAAFNRMLSQNCGEKRKALELTLKVNDTV